MGFLLSELQLHSTLNFITDMHHQNYNQCPFGWSVSIITEAQIEPQQSVTKAKTPCFRVRIHKQPSILIECIHVSVFLYISHDNNTFLKHHTTDAPHRIHYYCLIYVLIIKFITYISSTMLFKMFSNTPRNGCEMTCQRTS